MMIKEKLKTIWRGITLFFRFAIPVMIGVGLLWSIYWFVKDGYNQVFEPQKGIVSVKLTDAEAIIIERKNSCPSEYFDASVIINRFSFEPKSESYTIDSSVPIQFSINLPAGQLTITKYSEDKIINDNSISVQPGEGYSGTIESLSIEVVKMKNLNLEQYYCAPIVRFLPAGRILLSSNDGSNLQIDTKQWFNTGDVIKIVIVPIDITAFGDQNYNKIELMLNITKDFTSMGILTISPSLETSLPGIGYDQFGIWKNEVDNFFATTESVTVEKPAGTVRLANNPPVEMLKLAHLADETLELPSVSDNSGDEFTITSHITDGEYEISGRTTSVILNGQQLGKSYWDTLPEYVKAGLFGLLLSIVGGVWAFRQKIWGFLIPQKPMITTQKILPPPVGSFVCVMQSGACVAGELVSSPSFFFPFYQLRNARRKMRLEDEWNAEVIGEIRIRASLVEQSYIFGKSEAKSSTKNA